MSTSPPEQNSFDLISLFPPSTVTAIAAVLVTIIFTWSAHVRQGRALVRDALKELTTSEVASARNVLGTLVHSDLDSAVSGIKASEIVHAYYAHLWAIERTHAAFRVAARKPKESAFVILNWHLAEMLRNVDSVGEQGGSLKLADQHALARLAEVRAVLRPLRKDDEEAASDNRTTRLRRRIGGAAAKGE